MRKRESFIVVVTETHLKMAEDAAQDASKDIEFCQQCVLAQAVAEYVQDENIRVGVGWDVVNLDNQQYAVNNSKLCKKITSSEVTHPFGLRNGGTRRALLPQLPITLEFKWLRQI